MAELNQQSWNDFVLAAPHHTFLHSWQWGQLQENLHVPYWRLAIKQAGSMQALALVIKRELPWGRSWLYLPRGPVLAPGVMFEEVWPALNNQVREIAEKQQALFVRMDPAWSPTNTALLNKVGWVKAEREVQPQHTLVLDLNKTEEQLLADMHQKARYNIRLSEKKGVSVRFSTEAGDIEAFLTLSEEVQSRSPFRFHPPQYYRAMYTALAAAGMFDVAVAASGSNLLAAHLLIHFGDTVTYAHGASSSLLRQFMAPHLLQWESIKRAKAQQAARYDFFGVAPRDAGAQHPWAGITRFKEQFGGFREDYVGTHDLILDRAWYTAFTTARRLRRLWR